MSNVRFTSILALCAALAACSDRPANRDITAPDATPLFAVGTLSEGSATDLATGEAVVSTSDVGAEQAATGGRASGRADLTFSTTFGEQYSFIALSTAGPLFAAKGQFQGKIQFGSATYDLHAEVNCLRIIPPNRAVVSGPLTKFTIDGQPQPMNFDILFEVQDNGEGNPTVDLGSALAGVSSGIQACRLFQFSQRPSQDGNIQVSQR